MCVYVSVFWHTYPRTSTATTINTCVLNRKSLLSLCRYEIGTHTHRQIFAALDINIKVSRRYCTERKSTLLFL